MVCGIIGCSQLPFSKRASEHVVRSYVKLVERAKK